MKTSNNINLIIALYGHPDSYPPTINAIMTLSKKLNLITVVGRNIMPKGWDYPSNVELKFPTKYIDVRNFEKKTFLFKLYHFFIYFTLFFKSLANKKPKIVLVYDSISLFCATMFKPIFKFKLWYHNHDVTLPKDCSKFSIQGFAVRKEQESFNKIDFFSLPSKEREQYFPLKNFKGKYFFIPNYPSINFFSNHIHSKIKSQSGLKILFQGSIDKGHCIEEFIEIAKNNNIINELILIGWYNENFKQKINTLISNHPQSTKIKLLDSKPYKELIKHTMLADVGIAIYKPNSIMVKTVATASNKIYEYAGLGIPVILYDSDHFKKYLGNKKWAFFTDGSKESILKCLKTINNDYEQISIAAKQDFLNELNFESNFEPAINYILNSI